MRKSIQRALIVSIIIGLFYSYSGTGYLTWLYRVQNSFSTQIIDLLANFIDYFFQACGILIATLYLRIFPSNLRKVFIISTICEVFFIAAASLLSFAPATFVFGVCMDICFGIVFSSAIALIPGLDKRLYGMVIAIGWAMGSIFSYLIAIPDQGDFIKSPYTLIIYAILAIITIVLYPKNPGEISENIQEENKDKSTLPVSTLTIAIITIILIETTVNLGFSFPVADLTNGSVSLALSRSFYAIGLIIAGLVTIKSRHGGLILCLCAMLCPFLTLLFENYLATRTFLWALNYVLIGPITVICVVCFSDLAKYGIYIAGLGLFSRRIGQIAAYSIGNSLRPSPVVLITVTAALFIVSAFMATMLGRKMALINKVPSLTATDDGTQRTESHPSGLTNTGTNKDITKGASEGTSESNEPTAPDPELILQKFCNKYDISSREKEVLDLVLQGKSNPVIASTLYVSENTVKFHMKNLLKKTGCENRKQLKTVFDDFTIN